MQPHSTLLMSSNALVQRRLLSSLEQHALAFLSSLCFFLLGATYLAVYLRHLQQHPHQVLRLMGCCRRWSVKSATGAATGW